MEMPWPLSRERQGYEISLYGGIALCAVVYLVLGVKP
jgi:hypothetical protein